MNKITITMGEYPQTDRLRKEPVEWIILKEEPQRCLCVSKYLLDCKPYHDSSKNITWQDCTLRNWLNHDFLMLAFSAEEREKILLSTVENPAGNTRDYIFLLSADEAEDYAGYEERGAITTAYARLRGAWFLDENGEAENKGIWWLRYYGKFWDKEEGNCYFISCVSFDGYIERAAQGAEEAGCCIRPAFWLRTD